MTPAENSKAMVDLENIRFSYSEGDFALTISKLTVERGSTVAIIGPSGSGKTTLLHLIAGIRRAESGRIMVDGSEISSLSPKAGRDFRIKNIGLVFQDFELLEYLSVLDNILLTCRIHPNLVVTRQLRERAEELARQVGIADKLKRYATKLSQGEKQRVAFCRALLMQPVLVMADEPTGNLDPVNKDRVMDVLLEQVRATNTTLLTVTHDYDLLNRFDRVIDCKEFHCQSDQEQNINFGSSINEPVKAGSS